MYVCIYIYIHQGSVSSSSRQRQKSIAPWQVIWIHELDGETMAKPNLWLREFHGFQGIFFSTHPLNRSSMMFAWFNPLCSSCVRFNPPCWYVLMVNFHARGSLPWNSGSFLGPTAQEHLVGTTKWFLSWDPILYIYTVYLFIIYIYST